MGEALYNLKLTSYILCKELEDLALVFENFSENISDSDDNVFLKQSIILEKMLANAKKAGTQITITNLYRGLDELEKALIEPLDIKNKIITNGGYSRFLEIDYFDEKRFMEALDNQLESISTQYNLRADDDYNKLYMFVSSIQMEAQSSDDMLRNLANKYLYYMSNSPSGSQEGEETITINGVVRYKYEIFNQILDAYEGLIRDDIKQRLFENKKTSKR